MRIISKKTNKIINKLLIKNKKNQNKQYKDKIVVHTKIFKKKFRKIYLIINEYLFVFYYYYY